MGDERNFFLCGCSIDSHKNYSIQLVQMENQEILSSKRFDALGNEICPEHGLPKYGYLSPQIETNNGRQTDYSKMSSNSVLKIEDAKAEDRRDNRDPEELGKQILAERRTKSNGHPLNTIDAVN